jgi:hypothetical protein
VDVAPGTALNRDLVSSRSEEAASEELRRFIEKRHAQRVAEQGDEVTEAAWREAERREEARRQQEWKMGRLANCEHLADVFQKLADEHAAEAEKLRAHQPKGAAQWPVEGS